MLTPIDLETKEFKKKALGGYDCEEIDQFMAMLFQDYKTIYMENVALKDKVNMLSAAVTKYKSMEDVLQNTLIVAQTTSDELKSSAHDRAKIIMEDAENKAQQTVFEAQKAVSVAKTELKAVKTQISNYKLQMLATIRGIYDMVNNIPEDTERNDDNGLRQDA